LSDRETPPYRLAIALTGKGATNHLHRPEVAAAFAVRGIEVLYLVRKDYLPILTRLEHCRYFPLPDLQPLHGWLAKLAHLSREVRMRYPSTDPGLRERYRRMHLQSSFLGGLMDVCYCLLARSRLVVHLFMRSEKMIAARCLTGISDEVGTIDQLLLMGFGFKGSEIDGYLTWWGGRNSKSVVHIVGNYDNLSANGFRGAPVLRLLVWGSNMRRDAELIHDIPHECISEIGSIRYNALFSEKLKSPIVPREQFLESMGLDPSKKTILFAGFFFASQYFEMIATYLELLEDDDTIQLILRIYPNKSLMSSIYIDPLVSYAKTLNRVAVSVADPYYKHGTRGENVLQIEEFELWNSINSCDCLINVYSTIAIEGCLFDKPVLYMGYFPRDTGVLAREPMYYDYASNPHNRRLATYSAIVVAKNRKKLKELIRVVLSDPMGLHAERRRVVHDEIGVLDGLAHERMVDACTRDFLV